MRNGLQRLVWITAAAASLGITARSWETTLPQQGVQLGAESPQMTTVQSQISTTVPQTSICIEETSVTEQTCGTELFSAAAAVPAEAGVYDLNKVTRAELLLIAGMTAENADRILDMRAHIKRFTTIYDLTAIDTLALPYIKRVLFAQLYVKGDTVLGREGGYVIRVEAAG